MRVLIDTTFAWRAPHSGTGIYIRRICDELRGRAEVEVVEAANERRPPPAGGGLGSVRNLGADLWWSNRELPRIARFAGAEVIHHPLPARAYASRLPQVVTVVDLAFERLPDKFAPAFRTYAHHTHRAAARAAAAVVCVSETTAADARALWSIPGERIVVALLGPGQELGGASESRAGEGRPVHFLYVGDDEPRKDLTTLLEAYRRYRESAAEPLELVLAGSAAASGDGIRVQRRPGPRRLAELYADAAALVHPSLYEGFGLTTLEAMSVGTPVLAARAPGVVEICAGAARYVEPGDAAAFAAAMLELARDSSVRGQLSQLGRRRAAEFSWSACASAHLDAYSLALERR